MISHFKSGLSIALLMLATTISAAPAKTDSCITLGGTSLSQAIDSTNFIGTINGPFSGGARGEILSETKTPNGKKLEMEHFFLTRTGGVLRTSDTATLTNVEGRENVYLLEINYDIKDASGIFEGYDGDFESTGLINLETGKIVLRYEGEICK